MSHALATAGRTAEQKGAGLRLLLFVVGGGAAVLLQHVAPAPVLIVIAFGAIAIAMWHGAFDMVLAEELLPRAAAHRWQLWFIGTYVAAALAVGALWWLLPVLALAAFLLYSAWHFGTESLQRLGPGRALPAFCYGAIPIAAACRWHPQQVAPIFAAMLHGHAPLAGLRFAADAGAALWPLIAAFALGSAVAAGRRPGSGLPLFWWPALAAELLLFRLGAPLVAFAVYFCLWHTPEHLLSSSLDAQGRFSALLLRSHLLRGLLPWLVSLAALAGLCLWLRGRLAANESALFLLLSMLTVPHMLLNEVRRRRARHRPSPAAAAVSMGAAA